MEMISKAEARSLRAEVRRPRSGVLSLQHPHRPPGHEHTAKKHHKAICSITHHVACIITVRDPEDDGGEKREDQRCAEMIKSNRHRMNPREKG